jgi:hypothetical protein
VVALAVMGPDHGGVGPSQDRLAEPGEVLGPPGPAGGARPGAGPTRDPGPGRHSVADPRRRLARERLIAAIAARLVERGSTEREALLVPKLALACFQAAYERWVRRPGQDLPALVDESFADLAGLAVSGT